MNENALNTIKIDGLDETYAENCDVELVEAATVLIVDFIIDRTGSMDKYEAPMKDCLEHYKNAICNSKQCDEMLVSKTLFDDIIETGGYVKPEDFNTDYETGGCTRLYDTIIERRQRLFDYIQQLKNNGTNARGCVVILTDGEDNASRNTIGDARSAVKDMISKEIVVAGIAFGTEAQGIFDKLGLKPKNIKNVSNDESELRKIIDLVSKSAISASKRASAGATSNADEGFFDI